MNSIYEEILSAVKNNHKTALCTIISTNGSTPRKTGAKMLVYEDGKVKGSIGGGDLELSVIQDALKVIKQNKASVFKHDLLYQHAMCCGGTVEVFIEPLMNKRRLYIFGAGHTGNALAQFASSLDFDIFIIDDRKEYIDSINVAGINKMNLDFPIALKALPFDKNVFIVILTYSHQADRDILAYCIKKPFAYLGMIGSRRKIKMTEKLFLDGDIGTAEDLKKVNMPIGIDINAETPEEIAISILAEIIKVKNPVHEK
jgi:xanthine dehydrogenase accessory factor